MSHYKPYPMYKESGVEWLGRVPEHWQVKQFKYVAPHIGSGKTPSGGAEVYQDTGVLFLRSQNVYEDGLRLDDVAFITGETDEEMKGSRVRPGDVLLNITGASIGRSCLVPQFFEPANVNQHVCIIRTEKALDSKWISLCLPSNAVQSQIDFSQNGAGREGLNFEQIGNMSVALPPNNEIEKISSRVDRETARIYALVEKKTRFIELLREKRQALITHAVTKGLDPNVKMKDSGVEWLGGVPLHWALKPIKFVTKHIGSGKTPSGGAEVYQDSGVLFLRSQNVYDDGLRLDDAAYISPEIDADMRGSRVQPGDVLLNITGASIGRSCLAPDGLPAANVNQHVCIIRPEYRGHSEWLAAYFASNAIKIQIELYQGGAGREGLNFEQIGNMLVLLPSLEERQAIVAYLAQSGDRLGVLIEKTERSINLLKERRSALITAAVTGQIDLRETYAVWQDQQLSNVNPVPEVS